MRERACLPVDTPVVDVPDRTLAGDDLLCECQCVITGLAHTGVCVPDCEAAVAFYRDVLGLHVLSPPYEISSDALDDDMGELLPDPSMKAAIVGFEADGDRVFEVIEYVKPRMTRGQVYPPVVGMAVLRAREGLSNEDAEARLT